MQVAACLYRDQKVLTQIGAADPSMTLIENWREHCGVLLAQGCHQKGWSPTLQLEEVVYFRAHPKGFEQVYYPQVSLVVWDNLCGALEPQQGYFLPNMSRQPFQTVFLPIQDLLLQYTHLHEGKGATFFRFVQQHFGALPGFRAHENALTTPDQYAMVMPPDHWATSAA